MRNWLLPSVVLSLAVLSILTIKSVAPTLATHQLVFFSLGMVVLVLTSRFSYAFFENYRVVGYVLVCFLLIIPLLIGKTTRGIAGWIDIGTLFSIQPSQLAIPVVTLLLGKLLTQSTLSKFTFFLLVLGIIAVPAALIIVEPDLGTTVIYLATLGSLLFVSKTRWQHLALLAFAGLATITIAWFFFLEPYQKDRITSFVSSDKDLSGASYNAQQSLIAVGSGKTFGRGLGQGVQSHLRFLPERQTDFIFASLAEEWGFIGSVLVITLYAALIGICFWGFFYAPSPSASLYCLGAGMMTVFQASVNIGMNMGLFPITGITLPLLSYGGSSILAVCFMYGVVWGIVRRITSRAVLDVS